ncbi:MAG: CapA family protein [Peptococcaceae bacterium]|nr:CapA family protein [Peptococcaceae bacterium]
MYKKFIPSQAKSLRIMILISLAITLCCFPWLFGGCDLSAIVPGSSPESLPESTTKSPRTLTISAVGDCVLGADDRYVSQKGSLTFFDMAQNKDTSYFLAGVKGILGKDDMTFANLENVLISYADPQNQEPKPEQGNRGFWFYGSPHYVNILKQGGIDIVNIANNHSHDYQDAGYTETANILTQEGIPFTGYDDPALVTKNGIRVGSVGFNLLGKNERGVDMTQFKQDAAEQIKQLKSKSDVIVAQIHWGDEGSNMPNATQVDVGHFLIDAGADIVLGHHPHVLQPTELYKDRYIVYSLGNFCYGGIQWPGYDTSLTAIWQIEISLDNKEHLTLATPKVVPCSITGDPAFQINDYQPIPLTDDLLVQNVHARLAVMTTIELQAHMGRRDSLDVQYAYAPLTTKNAQTMVDAQKYISGLKKDMRYFTGNNFLKRPFYGSDKVYLRKGTAEKLKKVVNDLKAQNLSLMIWDAYRPPEAQWKMWEVMPDPLYIADPNTGYSKHSYGTTVDVTLADAQGKAVKMPTDFDDFSPVASHDLSNITDEEARKNLQILRHVMEANGFKIYFNEWWHYTDADDDSYGPVLDVMKLLEQPL